MWYSKQLRQVRRARKAAKSQQHQLVAMELEGIMAVTLYTATQTLTLSIEREVSSQVVDALREALHERRQVLKTEARQLRQDWWESETLRAKKGSTGSDQSLANEPTAP